MADNVEIVRAFAAGVAEGTPTDLTGVAADVEWHVEDTLPDPAVFHGHAGVREFFAGLREVWEDLRFEADEYIAEGDRVLAAFRQIAHGAGGAVPVEQRLYGLFDHHRRRHPAPRHVFRSRSGGQALRSPGP